MRRAAKDIDVEPREEALAAKGSLHQPASWEDDLDWFIGSAPTDTEERAAQAWLDVLPSELS